LIIHPELKKEKKNIVKTRCEEKLNRRLTAVPKKSKQ